VAHGCALLLTLQVLIEDEQKLYVDKLETIMLFW